MVFSEFGRLVGENASGGTDLGAGDLKYTMDLRRVYAGILPGWPQADAAKVVGREHEPLTVVI